MPAVYLSTSSFSLCSSSLFGDTGCCSCHGRLFLMGSRRGSQMCMFSSKDLRGGWWCVPHWNFHFILYFGSLPHDWEPRGQMTSSPGFIISVLQLRHQKDVFGSYCFQFLSDYIFVYSGCGPRKTGIKRWSSLLYNICCFLVIWKV